MLTIVDYIGHSDKYGKPMGHPVKVIKEMVELLSAIDNIGVAAPDAHLKEISCDDRINKIKLNHYICTFSSNKKANLWKKLKNLHRVFRSTKGVLWFVNVDFSLFLYLYLFGCHNRRVWINLCYNPLKHVSARRKSIIENVLKKVDLVIVTNENFLKVIPGNTIFVPDYYYNNELYQKYFCNSKKQQVVCLGTMGENKQLEKLVECSENLHMPLMIVGNFSQNHDRFKKLEEMSKASENVFINNKYVGNNEYYQLIAESKFVILPYDMEMYDERTSGILIESMFLKSIPIAPQQLLDYNAINGIGYERLEDLSDILLNDEEKLYNILLKNEELINCKFSKVGILQKISKYL